MAKVNVKKGGKAKGGNANKNKLMARIHILKKDKGLDDDTYRDVLERVTGKRSCKEMTVYELGAVVRDMSGKGYAPSPNPSQKEGGVGKKPRVADSRKAMIGKIEAIILDMGLSWEYVRGMAQKMFGKQYEYARVVEWLNDEQVYKLTQALAMYQKRKSKKDS